MDTTTAARKSKKATKAPRFWWDGGTKQYVCKIGYKLVSRMNQSMRVRDFQRLGPEQNNALRLTLQLRANWLQTINFF